jgi:hypothetical protein
VFLWNGAGFDVITKDPEFGWDEPGGSRDLLPGQGAFVKLPAGTANTTVTFVGEVDQGQNLTVPIAAGFNLISSRVPQEGTAQALGYTPAANDTLYFWSEANQRYDQIVFDPEFGFDAPLPVMPVGDAFFLNSKTGGRTWTRSFSVNG